MRIEIRALDDGIGALRSRIAEIETEIFPRWDPRNWFATDQAERRRNRDQLQKSADQQTAHRRARSTALGVTEARITRIQADLRRHQSFNLQQREAELSNTRTEIASRRAELEPLAERKRRVDEVLAPLLHQLRDLDAKRCQAESDLADAEDFQQQLSSATNSYERALIHRECEGRFGDGSPGRIVTERQREIRQLTRDSEKTRRRVEETARLAARKIDKIIIDGNNLCYQGNTFIGFVAIESLLPELSGRYLVIVVFDAKIRRLLNSDDSAITERLGRHAAVHIVASRRRDDETVLDLASADESTFVLSNDRFGDFSEKPAVKENRIIRHEIVDRQVFVHDLQLRTAFG